MWLNYRKVDDDLKYNPHGIRGLFPPLEADMHLSPFVFAFAVITIAQDTEETKRAIAVVKKVNGQLEFDDKAPGRPVIGLNL